MVTQNTGLGGGEYAALFRRHAAENDQKWAGVNRQSGQQRAGGPTHKIGPRPMSASAQATMASILSQPTRTWGGAARKIASTFIAKMNADREGEAKQADERALNERRGIWAKALHAGETLRNIASNDPQVLNDKPFLDFAASTAPEVAEEVELFEDVQDPYGKGGFGQRSSTTGKISGYQSAPAQAKPAARPTAKDKHGRLRYLDDSSAAFSDDVLGPDPTPPPSQGPSEKDMLAMTRQLSDDWQKTARPMQGLLESRDRMDIGLAQAEEGDMLSGSQAILITFNKMLDPTSVVRESEYARSATGQSAIETIKGYADKLARGGAGVTLSELRSYKRFADQVVAKALESTIAPERLRISRLAERFGVDPDLIFSGKFAPQDAAPLDAPEGMPQTAPQSPEIASTQAMMSPRGQAGQAPQADAARVGTYSQLKPDELKRQAAIMQANHDDYTDEERRAMGLAWRAKFGE